ncbi:hypothetical protein XAC3607_3700001 [Xanthomonas citri pv. citri]|nr:hypothetical protein XAC2911_550001 [Xanthomonas citri pv. citri]CEH91857.1 hypothetical protein XAC3607_3700001 [Xanthomonas citri pv. citri]
MFSFYSFSLGCETERFAHFGLKISRSKPKNLTRCLLCRFIYPFKWLKRMDNFSSCVLFD